MAKKSKKNKKTKLKLKLPKEYQDAIDYLPEVVRLETKRAKERKALLKRVFSDAVKILLAQTK